MKVSLCTLLLFVLTACSGGSSNSSAPITADDNVVLAGIGGGFGQFDEANTLTEIVSGIIIVDGESYPLSNWQWSIESDSTVFLGAGGGGGRARIGNLRLLRPVDALTVLLADMSATGIRIEEITLQTDNSMFLARDVDVVRVSVGAAPFHEAEFTFKEYTFTVNGQSTCLDVAQNRSC